MMIFDLLLLISVSVYLATKNLYLGSVTLILGLLIGFQTVRTQFLLGKKVNATSLSRRIKAGVLAAVIAACAFPLLVESGGNEVLHEVDFNSVSLLPITVLIGLFSAALMAALTVEKRKR